MMNHLQRQVGAYTRNDALKVFRAKPRHEVLATGSSCFPVQPIQSLKADGVEHVALHPQLLIPITGKRVCTKKMMPTHLDLGSRGRNGNNGAQLATMRISWRDNDNLTHLQHFRGNKSPSEVAQQHIALLRVVVERQSINPIKAKPPEGGFNRHAVELASPRLRRWINPKGEPDSCRLSPVTPQLWDYPWNYSSATGLTDKVWDELGTLASRKTPAYSSPAGANSPAGFGHLIKLAHERPSNTKAGAIFSPVTSRYDGRARESFGSAGCQLSQLTNLRTAVTHSFGHERDSSKPKVGAPPMKHTLAINPSASHAAAWKARAMAALRADSSLSVRLARYNAAMTRSRELEVQGGAV